MEKRHFGSTGYQVSPICFGTLTMAPFCANLPLAEGAALLREAAACGINFFDTAQQYDNYAYLREAFAGQPEQVIIASKSYAETYAEMAWAVEEARIALQRDKIDIFLLHEQKSAAALRANLPALEYLHDAKANGIVGAVGISTHHVGAAELASQMAEVEVLHAMANYRGIGVSGGSGEAMLAALKAAHQAGKAVYGMKAIGGGSLMGVAREALQWAFQQDYLDSVAIGMKDRAELITNLGWYAGEDPPEAASVQLLDRNLVFDPPPSCSLCGACCARCHQNALRLSAEGVQWQKERCLYCGYCIRSCANFCISFC